ncbi:unnamed protein product [Phytophthora lilii]|uniref:Unnamed protein product n=1 Tax=Phytophthora lilii TaxID=2077276 RepID=A0A9W6TUU4_9STRA|nr:unnamed protein product [Phytophthora lilii]
MRATKWYDDEWIVHVMIEFQVLMVFSWDASGVRFEHGSQYEQPEEFISARNANPTSTLRNSKSKTNGVLAVNGPLNPTLYDIEFSHKHSKLQVVMLMKDEVLVYANSFSHVCGGGGALGLRDIEFCITNLHALPEDFDLNWSASATIYFEARNPTEAPYDLSLALNPTSSVLALLLEGNSAFWMHAQFRAPRDCT